MKSKETIRDWLDQFAQDMEIKLLVMDGYDDCLIGVCRVFNTYFAVYDERKVIEKLIRRDGMTEAEAYEFFEFNQAGAYVGEATPGFVIRPPWMDGDDTEVRIH